MIREDITADSIVEYAKKNGIELDRGAVYWEFPRLCAANVVLHMFVGKDMLDGGITRFYPHDDRIPFDADEFRLIECGFENFNVNLPYEKHDPLYLMCAEIARKVGYIQ